MFPSLTAEKFTSFKDSSDLEDLIAEEMNDEVSGKISYEISQQGNKVIHISRKRKDINNN